jgi:hypothetical protein
VHVHDARVPDVSAMSAALQVSAVAGVGAVLAGVAAHVAIHAEQLAAGGVRALERWWRVS